MAFKAQMLFRLTRDRRYNVLEVDNGLAQGRGKPLRKKHKVTLPLESTQPLPILETKSRMKLEILQMSYLNAEGWNVTSALLIRKTCAIREASGRKGLELYSKESPDKILRMSDLLRAVQHQATNLQEDGCQMCFKCKLRTQCEFLPGNLCTLCVFGYEIATAKASGCKLIIADVRGKFREYDMTKFSTNVHVVKSKSVSKQHFKLLAYLWDEIEQCISSEKHNEVARLTARILNDPHITKSEGPFNSGLTNRTLEKKSSMHATFSMVCATLSMVCAKK
jgi:hypothetical protein